MSRIPKSKLWRITWTWTGAPSYVMAPTRLLAKMNASHARQASGGAFEGGGASAPQRDVLLHG